MKQQRRVFSKSRRLQIYLVSIVTAIVVCAIIFVGCIQRFFFILPGMVLLVSIICVIWIFCQACCDLMSRSWPKANGSIIRAIIERSYMPNGGKDTGKSSPRYAYSITVDYDYAVGGKRYKGTRVSFVKKDYASWKEADVVRRHFLQDKKINVFYCPLIPSLSCITHIQFRDIVISVSTVVAFSAGSLLFTLLAFYYLP